MTHSRNSYSMDLTFEDDDNTTRVSFNYTSMN